MFELKQTIHREGEEPKTSTHKFFERRNGVMKRIARNTGWPTAALAELRLKGVVEIEAENGYLEIELKEVE